MADLARLERAVTAMEELPRRVFFMHLLDGFGYVEIGKRLRLSVGEVERQFAAAIYYMSCALDDDEESNRQ